MADYKQHLDELEQASTDLQLVDCFNKIYSAHRTIPTVECPDEYYYTIHPGAVKSLVSYFNKEVDLKLRGTILGVIAILSRNEENENQLRDQGVYDYIEKSFIDCQVNNNNDNNNNNRRMKKNILWVLSNVANKDKSRTDIWMQRIIEIMKEYKTHQRIQQYGCGALTEIARINGRAKSDEALVIILETMKTLKDIESIQIECLGSIKWLYPEGGIVTSQHTCVFETLKANFNNPDIVWQGLKTLSFLAKTAVILNKEYYKFVFEILRRHKDNKDIVLNGLILLYRAKGQDKDTTILNAEGVPELIMDVMKNFKKITSIQLHACGLLSYVEVESWSVEKRREALDTIYASISLHSENPEIYKFGLFALDSFAKYMKNAEFQELLALILRTMDFITNRDIVYYAFLVLDTFVSAGYSLQLALAPKVIEYVITGINTHSDSQEIGTSILSSFLSCGNETTIYPRFVQLGGIQCLIECVQAWPYNENIFDCFAGFKDKMHYLAGYEEQIAQVLVKYEFKTGNSSFGDALLARYSDMLGMHKSASNIGLVPAILSLESLAAKVISSDAKLFPPSIVSNLPDMVRDKIELLTKTTQCFLKNFDMSEAEEKVM